MAGKTPKKRTNKSIIARKKPTRSKRAKNEDENSVTELPAAPAGFDGPGEQVARIVDNADVRVMVPVASPAVQGRKVLCIEDGVVFWGTPP